VVVVDCDSVQSFPPSPIAFLLDLNLSHVVVGNKKTVPQKPLVSACQVVYPYRRVGYQRISGVGGWGVYIKGLRAT